jgi:hypothetical protein
MNRSKYNVRYIVVHSTQTLPTEMHIATPYHLLIHRSGRIEQSKKLQATDGCLQLAYVGGVEKNKEKKDTRTSKQTEILFQQIVQLSEQFPTAKIVGADEIFGDKHHPGFTLKEWLKNYMPPAIAQAA